MSTTAIELPLFPLDTVLFPGTVLPLHIFEPRYRQMIIDCERENKPLGIVLVKPGSEYLREEPYPIGTMAEIRSLNRLEDGRYNLMAVGVTRFRIVSQHHNKPYLSGIVELYEDVSEPESELAVYAHDARSLFKEYLELLLKAANEENVQVNLPDLPEEISYFIASIIETQDEQKQHFLELNATSQRLQEEIRILYREVPFMRQILSKELPDERARLN